MNKKFTFMVAALLAAGGFSANAAGNVTKTDLDDLNSTDVVYIISDVNTGNQVSAGDQALGIKTNTDGFAYDIKAVAGADVTALNKNLSALGENNMWYVVKNSNSTYSFVNKATEEKLAYTVSELGGSGTISVLLTNAEIKEAQAKNLYFTEFTEADGIFSASIPGVTITNSKLNIGESNISFDGTGEEVLFVKPMDVPNSVSELAKYGKTSFTFENISDHVFNNITFIGVGNDANTTDVLLMVTDKPTSVQNNYVDLGKGSGYNNITILKTGALKDSKFIILSNETATTAANATDATGYKYKVVKGSELANALASKSSEGDNKGKYPVENAVFQVSTNALKPNQIALSQTGVIGYNATDKEWSAAASSPVKVGVLNVGTTYALASAASTTESVWATLGATAGTEVKAKDFVKGKMIVNVVTTQPNMTSFICALGLESGAVDVIEGRDEANAALQTLSSQWYVSANADNSITLINRDDNTKKVENIKLYKKDGVYTALGSDVLVNRQLKITELETTMFDGFLKLGEQELKHKYVLTSKDYNAGLVDVDVYWAQDENTPANIIPVSSEDADKAIEWTISTVMKESDDEKIDTAFVETAYNYFDGETLKEAKDKLAAFRYTLKSDVTGDDNNTLGSSYTLVKDAATEVVFKKAADGKYYIYQLASNKLAEAATPAYVNSNVLSNTAGTLVDFTLEAVDVTPSYNPNGQHFALSLNGAYLGANSQESGIMTNDTTLLKSTEADASFSFYAFSADKEEELVPSYYLSTNGKMMYNPADSVKHYEEAIANVGLDEELKETLKAELAKYAYSFDDNTNETVKTSLVKFQPATYAEDAKAVVVKGDTITKDDNSKFFKFNLLENENGTVSVKANSGEYVSVVNSVAVISPENKAEFTVVDAAAPTSNESVSASEVAVVAQNGSVVVKNAAGKNVVVSTILGQVVANEVLTSDNATINVPAGIVVVAVEGESFKVNVK